MRETRFMRIGRHPRLILALLCCLLSLPFLQQAFHIDDRIYLEVADNILHKPFYPYDYPVLFEGLVTPDAASHSHLPSTSYYLALVRLLAGRHLEWAHHLAFIAFAVLAVWAFYDLSRRLVRFPLAAAALLLVSPGFFVLSHTLMSEIPLTAFWLLALSRFLPICRGEARGRDWLLCALGLGGAAMTSLLTVGLVGLMAAWALACARGRQTKAEPLPVRPMAALLLLPLFIWLLWYGRAYLHYDRFLLVNTVLHMEKRETFDVSLLWLKLGSFVLNLGGAFLFPPVLWYGLAGGWSARLFGLGFFIILTPFALWFDDWTWTQALLLAAFLSTGAMAVLAVGREAGSRLRASGFRLRASGFRLRASGFGLQAPGSGIRKSDSSPQPPASSPQPPPSTLQPPAPSPQPPPSSLQPPASSPQPPPSTLRPPAPSPQPESLLLPLWFFGILAACLLLFYAGSVRYTLLAVPPLILIWMRALEAKLPDNGYLLRNLIWLGFFLTLPYSLWIARADFRFAEMYRQAARQAVEEYSSEGRTVWFTAEWGLRYYLEQQGAKPLPRVSVQPAAGDIILKPYVAFPWVTLYDAPQYSQFLGRRLLDMPGRLRLLDFTSRAGFYSTGWGILPFGINEGKDWEWINVYQVKKQYDGPIPEQERHW